MKLERFSKKQMILLTWWCQSGPFGNRDAVICDGAVRSGKTLCTVLSFISWSFYAFDGQAFAVCGKTLHAVKRNAVTPLIPLLSGLGFQCKENISSHYLDITYNGRKNRYYLFGGKDEGSAALIQGMTLAGVLFDEVALMPRSFVEQALARCSVTGSKFWFNCNPEHPFHWFYREWIQKATERNALYLHFTMADNPSLSKEVRARYEQLYEGCFYERFVLGKWIAAIGQVYPMFDRKRHLFTFPPEALHSFYVSVDYGTRNPTSMGLWGKSGETWYRIREFYHSGRDSGMCMTDEEYYTALLALCEGREIRAVIVDPSAASFIECIRRHGTYRVIAALNDVLPGIRRVADALRKGNVLFSAECKDTIREFSLYSWEEKGYSDKVRKEHDHAMDDIRYFVSTVLAKDADDDFFARIVVRQ